MVKVEVVEGPPWASHAMRLALSASPTATTSPSLLPSSIRSPCELSIRYRLRRTGLLRNATCSVAFPRWSL
eukprot:7511403-Pyramimonas_sp.AAC.1